MINPLLIKAGMDILSMVSTGDKSEDLNTVKKVFTDHSVPFWKQKKFIAGIVAIVSAVVSYFLGFPIESLVCVG